MKVEKYRKILEDNPWLKLVVDPKATDELVKDKVHHIAFCQFSKLDQDLGSMTSEHLVGNRNHNDKLVYLQQPYLIVETDGSFHVSAIPASETIGRIISDHLRPGINLVAIVVRSEISSRKCWLLNREYDVYVFPLYEEHVVHE